MQRPREKAAKPAAAGELQLFKAQFFRALANPIRIRILEVLLPGGQTVQALQRALGLNQPIVSQQLAVLRNRGIVSAHKEGLSMCYTVRDPLVADLLDVARRIFTNQFHTTRGLHRQLQRERRRSI